VQSHYHVLDIEPDADNATVRAAYRRLARDHHPDRVASSSAVSGGRDMPAINEAYRVLNDPGRRALYDRSLGTPTRGAGPAHSRHPGNDTVEPEEHWDYGRPDMDRPARVPWRSLLVFGSFAVFSILVLAQFSGIDDNVGPDGILRNGDCVEIQANGDAREILCVDELDLVVRAFIPFDGTCPGRTEPHRDRQGMGVACIQLPD
jgi:molecular chaperone DnaJ